MINFEEFDELGDIEIQEDRVEPSAKIDHSGIYPMEIKMAYFTESKNGAKAIVFNFEGENGEYYRHTEYFTNREGKPYYLGGRNKDKKLPLPGYTKLLKYSTVITGNKDAWRKTDETKYPIYDFDKKEEVETNITYVPEFVGKVVQLAIREVIEDKEAYNTASGKYEPTGDVKTVFRMENMLDGPTGKTAKELEANLEPSYKEKFLKLIAEKPVSNEATKAAVEAKAKKTVSGEASTADDPFSLGEEIPF